LELGGSNLITFAYSQGLTVTVTKCLSQRIILYKINPMVDKVIDDFEVARVKNVPHVHQPHIGTMPNQQLNKVKPLLGHCMEKSTIVVALLNFGTRLQEDLNHAVTARVYGVLERRAPS
jgi:hypothetical protein